MSSISLYNELCRIDMINNHLESAFPFTLRDDVQFTQHEVVLNYKQNYCQTIKVLSDNDNTTVGGSIEDPSYVYMLY